MKSLWTAAAIFFLVQGCATTSETVDINVPVIDVALDPSTEATQAKAGVTMTFVKPVVEMKKYENTRLKDTSIMQKAFNTVGQTSKLYSVEQYPVYFPKDEFLTFQVRVKNNLNRPLRLNGSLLSIEMSEKPLDSHESTIIEPQELKKSRLPQNRGAASIVAMLAGKEEIKKVEDVTWNGVTEEQVAEIHRIVILPGKEKEVMIRAPRHINIPDQTSFVVNLMDVTTKVDAASNPTEKQSFSWVINYKRSGKKTSETVVAVDKLLDPMDVALIQSLNKTM